MVKTRDTADTPLPLPILTMMRTGPLLACGLLFAGLYAAYGTQSPFFPAFLGARGLAPEQIGLVLGYGTAVKLVASPLAGRLADRLGTGRLVLCGFAGGTGVLGVAFFAASGLWATVLVLTLWSVAIAPLAPLADTLALAASGNGRRFPYGWVRGLGSGAFVGGTLVSGALVDRLGLGSTMVVSGVLFAFTAAAAFRLRAEPVPRATEGTGTSAAVRTLLAIAPYRNLLAVAALVMGSHAMSDSFAVIRWREAGLTGFTVSVLWSSAVVAEVVVFFLLGPLLLARIGPAGGAAVAAGAGILRWGTVASTTAVPALAAAQTLHGLTFALLHLSAMTLIGRVVPPALAATGQTLYGAVAVGIANVLLTLASGPLYAGLGAGGFWIMATLCLLALPLCPGLRATPPDKGGGSPTKPDGGH